MKYVLNAICIILFLFHSNLYAQVVTDNSDWRGYITINNSTLPFLIHLSKNKETGSITGTCESPQQTSQAYILHNISVSDSEAHFEFNAGYGNAVFNGLLHGDSMDGTYTQNKLSGDFELLVYSKHTDTSKVKAPASFYEENVTLSHDNITLAGTLTKPMDGVKHTVVVFITGSGAQDRDESVYGFKPFKLLAAELATHGYAVLRLDDRGMGLSKGKIVEASTTIDLANDIQRGITFLHTRLDVDANHIVLLGHGEGATIAALLAANDPEVQGIIALTPPALKGRDIELQIMDSAREPGVTPKLYNMHKKALSYYFNHPRLSQPDDSLQYYFYQYQALTYNALSRTEKMKYTDSANYIRYMSTVMRAQVFSHWYRFYKDYDPAPVWQAVHCPVLALYASRDKEICSSTNRPVLQKNIKAPATLTLYTIDGANHLFEKAQTGLPSEYSKLTKEFIPGFTNTIIQWLQNNVH